MPAAFYIMPDYGEEAETMPSIHYQYTVDGDDFTLAGEASSALKQTLKLMNLDADIIRRCAIAMYEGEINMVIHANGGIIDVDIFPDKVVMVLTDHGPGIPDVPLAILTLTLIRKRCRWHCATMEKALKTLSLPCRRDIPPPVKKS